MKSELMADDFGERVRANQNRLAAKLKLRYDFVVCGSGSSGSVVARRLAENPDVSVLLVEAGGDDDIPNVTDAGQWPTNIGSVRDWAFRGVPNPRLNGRSLTFSMGKVLGGGSAINVMLWARGHQSDWDFFAAEADDPAWGYKSVLDIYRRVEDWHGSPDPTYRGSGGPIFVQPAPDPSPLAHATVCGAESVGIPAFESPNGQMMEGRGGAALADIRSRNGSRQSVFRSYVYPYLDRPNLTVLTHAHVTRVTFDRNRATGVEIFHCGTTRVIGAECEVVLSLGAMHTPKVLMHSGIGDKAQLRRFGIDVRQHLAGVGQNFQDHVAFYCGWEYQVPLPPRNNMSEATLYWTTMPGSEGPDVFVCQGEMHYATEETATRYGLPTSGWSLAGGLAQPKSRGAVRLTGPDPDDPIQIDANTLADHDDLEVAIACIQLCREVGNSRPLRPFVRREVMPGNLTSRELDGFIRDAATSYWHACGTAKMGRDPVSVVDGACRVHGVENLRVADASIMPRITTGNTMAPCVVIGERVAEMLKSDHEL